MQGSNTNPQYYRDKGLEFLQKGKEYFNSHTEYEYREKGYQLYKKGLDYVIKYAKCTIDFLYVLLTNSFSAETNADLVAKVKSNLNDWIKEAKSMEATVYQQQQQQQPAPSNNNNYAPNNNYNPAPINQQNNYAPPSNNNGNYQPSNPTPSKDAKDNSGTYEKSPGHS